MQNNSDQVSPAASPVQTGSAAAIQQAAAPAAASTTTGSLSGYVFFEPATGATSFNPTSPATGQAPLAGVSVTLTGSGGTETVATDASGAYSFDNLAPGTYSLSVAVPSGDADATSLPNGNGTAGTGTITGITIAAGQSQTNEDFPMTTASKQQLGQIYFTASLLVSGAQIPLAPFEQVVTPAPMPNVPQQVSPPTSIPGFSGRTVQVAGATSLPPGGSGGDQVIGGANPSSPLFEENVQDELWTQYGEQMNNWLNQAPEQSLIQGLNDLGNMDLLVPGSGASGQNLNSTPGSGGDNGNTAPTNIYDKLFNLNDRQSDGGVAPEDLGLLPEQQAATDQDAVSEVEMELAAMAPIGIRRLADQEEWSTATNVSAAAVAMLMLAVRDRAESQEAQAAYFERRRKR
ncbi:MAG TPA: carboxypeptidase regulatory-like domain-containing protein [Pirellulales bacterium]|nr:carboxypeptidase regulatory-like domain-containing protein [Pirellulales bacterium]